jgi:hypothetical protein
MVNSEFAPKLQGIVNYLDGVGYNIYSLGGYVNRDVRGQPGVKSVHAHGGAIDINPKENPFGQTLITDMPADVAKVAASMGLGWGGNWRNVKDAMHFSVAKNEGGTVDLSKRGAETGGVFKGPRSGYPVELHGEEAVIPLDNSAGNFVKLFEEMTVNGRELLGVMSELLRVSKNSVDVQQKILRMQS